MGRRRAFTKKFVSSSIYSARILCHVRAGMYLIGWFDDSFPLSSNSILLLPSTGYFPCAFVSLEYIFAIPTSVPSLLDTEPVSQCFSWVVLSTVHNLPWKLVSVASQCQQFIYVNYLIYSFLRYSVLSLHWFGPSQLKMYDFSTLFCADYIGISTQSSWSCWNSTPDCYKSHSSYHSLVVFVKTLNTLNRFISKQHGTDSDLSIRFTQAWRKMLRPGGATFGK